MSSQNQGALLLILPLPIYCVNEMFFLDSQACNGLRLWLDNFEKVTLCLPVLSVAEQPQMTSSLQNLLSNTNLEIQTLPMAHTPAEFVRRLPETARLLNGLISDAAYLQFAIGGFWGDWGAVAAILAFRRERRAAIWTDRVESKVMAFQALQHTGIRRLYRKINAALAWRLERYVIRRSAMGLFHGMDTLETYSPLSRSAHLVHDIHLGPEARIPANELAEKASRPSSQPLRIVYGGRVHPDKGVKDWIETVNLLKTTGVAFNAVWFGDGPELAFARDLVSQLDLGVSVTFPGPVQNHNELIRQFRAADVFMFCHKTPESPRCLVEALLSGTPIVGYDGFYPRDLIRSHGGGRLTASTPAALAAELNNLACRRGVLTELSLSAAKDGYPLVDEEVFRHRSNLIKSLL